MFHLAERLSTGSRRGPRSPRQYIQRAALFGAGLLLLWLAIRLIPSDLHPSEPTVYSDGTGAVAAHPKPSKISFLRPGNVAALLLLAGGVAVAVYLRRRKSGETTPGLITPLGEVGIGQQQQLKLVRCADEVLLLGVTASRINLLRTYSPDAFEADLLSDEGDGLTSAPTAPSFSDTFRQAVGRAATDRRNGTA